MSVTLAPSTKRLRSNNNHFNGITNERVSDAPSSQLLEMLNLRLQKHTQNSLTWSKTRNFVFSVSS